MNSKFKIALKNSFKFGKKIRIFWKITLRRYHPPLPGSMFFFRSKVDIGTEAKKVQSIHEGLNIHTDRNT